MSQPGGFSYRPNVNRAVTKKWKEAAQANYGGDDWGDEDEEEDYDEPAPQPVPMSAGNPRHPAWGPHGQIAPPNRSVTNPSPPRGGGRTSFDHGDERRNFSAGPSGFDSAYPTSQRPPFPEPQHDFEPRPQNFRPQPPQLYTQGPSPYLPSDARPGPRQQQSPYGEGPFSAPGGYMHRRSESGNRPGPPPSFQQHESPVRPGSQASNQSGKSFPPRKSSLSQEQAPSDIPFVGSSNVADQSENNSAPAPKALPFIRPADIYKRMEEEREKERRSQDSSRPSVDLTQTKTRDSSTSARSSSDDVRDQPSGLAEDNDSNRKLKPTLDTVMERKSEYGFENMLKEADPNHPSAAQAAGVERHPTNASSVYTDRPDPVSASSISRDQSLRGDRSVYEPTSAHSQTRNYMLPSIAHTPGREASLQTGTTELSKPTSDTSGLPLTPPAPPVPNKDDEDSQQQHNSANTGSLGHKPSLGYTSVVHQAFDESQIRDALSPVSADNSVLRSNSASTAEISPIIARGQEQAIGPSGPPVTQQPIPEEVPANHTRSISESTVTPHDKDLPEPPRIRPGYRRDTTPPSRDNSPAKKLSVQPGSTSGPVYGLVGATIPESGGVENQAGSNTESMRGRMQPATSAVINPMSSNALKPSMDTRSTSEEYLRWQAEGRTFKERAGIQDSNPTTPSVTSPSYPESPNRSTVKQLTEKLESNSGRSSPVKDNLSEPFSAGGVRPQGQPRMESFRPALPGGWQSYTGTPGSEVPPQDNVQPLHPPWLKEQGKLDSTESIPTARAPKEFAREQGPQHHAFAAAAMAGTALAGAFGGEHEAHQTSEESHESSENEWDQSSDSSKDENDVAHPRDSAAFTLPANEQASTAESTVPPPPLPKDTPRSAVLPSQVGKVETPQDQTNSQYFPAPLRTSRSIEPTGAMRPPIPMAPAVEESPVNPDNEQLQQDIVKSLTPRSSNVETKTDSTTAGASLPMTAPNRESLANTSSIDEDDMYGGGTPRLISSSTQEPQKAFSPQQNTEFVESLISGPSRRPMLDQRFSWEMESDGQNATPRPISKRTTQEAESPTKPDIPRHDLHSMHDDIQESKPDPESPATPAKATHRLSYDSDDDNTHQRGAISSPVAGVDDFITTTPMSPQPPTPITKNVTSISTAPNPAEKSFRHIMKIDNQQQRIKAFDENRGVFGRSDGGLDQWIQSMQTPEHADLFGASGRLQPVATSTGNTPNKNSPNRPTGAMTGTKLMKEDGKRLVAAAGTLGGKTGKAAKGLFAKGKDKFRAASAGDKGLFTNRRKSTDLLESSQTETSKRNSMLLSAPPQLPAQKLEYSPIDTDEWGLPSDRSHEEASKHDGAVTMTKTNEEAMGKPISIARTIDEDEKARSADKQNDDMMAQSDAVHVPVIPISTALQTGEPAKSTDRTAETAILEEQKPEHLAAVSQPKQDAPFIDRTAETTTLDGQRPEHPAAVLEGAEPDLNQPSSALHPGTVPTLVVPVSDGNALAVPSGRRASVASTVSSASSSPVANQAEEQNARRSVSPDDQARVSRGGAPSYNSVPTKEEEAAREQDVALAQDDPVPSYHEGSSKRQSKVPRIGPDAQIVHVTDLSAQKRNQVSKQSRPFSFEGSETINRAIQQQMLQDNNTSQPLSPISQVLSKDLSQVSTEEVTEDQNGIGKRQSKSYSRPFGADPISDHPALRQPDSAIDRSQVYSSESPLPSARRPLEELERLRTNSPPVQQVVKEEEEDDYRIPGPYHMEYRSPRRSSPQTGFPPVQQRQSPLTQNPPTILPDASADRSQIRPAERQQTAPLPTERPQSGRGKQRSFIGIFRNRSQSRSRRDNNSSANVRNNSRNDSMNSYQSESRDVVGQLQPPEKKQRRFSRDPTRSTTPTGDPKEAKKKRFSAMGNLFGRSGKTQEPTPPQRASTLPPNTSQPTRQGSDNFEDQQQAYSAAVNRAYSGEVIRQFSGTPPPPGGYYAPSSRDGHTQPSQMDQSNWHQQRSPEHAVRSNYFQQPSEYSSYQPPSQRPTNLHIDTGGNQQRTNSIPATAPPHTYAPRDISYQSRAYNPVSTRGAESAAAPSNPSAHVVDLHKRSRSPKLGRRSSEDERLARAQSPPTEGPGLGTFRNKKLSPVGGIPRSDEEQEAPYRITLPGDTEEQKRRTRQLMIEQGQLKDVSSVASTTGSSGPSKTVAERMAGPQLPGSDAPSGVVATRAPLQERPNGGLSPKGDVAELPGSRANGYESEEEIPMSATAGPGQWSDPLFMGEWRDD